jgi:glycosyltransferase involved in cell wall biosynthesis
VFIERLAVALVARGHRITMVVPADAGSAGRERRHGVDILRVRYGPARAENLAYRGTMQQAAGSLLGKVALASLINAEARAVARVSRIGGAQVVHAHWWVPAGLAAWLARFTGGSRFLVTLHGSDVALLERSRLARTLARRVLRKAAVVTAVSSFLAERVESAVGFDSRRVVLQPMPVQLEHFARTSSGGGGVVTVGRLVDQKRTDIVLDAVARLRERGKVVRLTVVGDGPKRNALETRAVELGIASHTRFCGAVPPERLTDVIGDADVLAFPARGEGLGLAAAEALMLGVPVVACQDGGGVTDIVPPSGAGRLVAPGDAAQMARAIDELMSDASPRALAAETGRLLRRRLDPDYVAETYEELYGRVLRRRRRQ